MVRIVKQLQAWNRLQGGIFNKESIFQPIYQMLLALHTAAFCCHAAKVELPFKMSLLQQAAVELCEESLHPVLAAMLANTLSVWSAAEADILQKVSLVQSSTQSSWYFALLCILGCMQPEEANSLSLPAVHML